MVSSLVLQWGVLGGFPYWEQKLAVTALSVLCGADHVQET